VVIRMLLTGPSQKDSTHKMIYFVVSFNVSLSNFFLFMQAA